MNKTFKTKDSALSYYVNQLENLDPKLHMPLTSVTWGRDVKLRPGVSLGDEAVSYIQGAFAGTGTLSQGKGNIPWISAETTTIPGVSIDGQKKMIPLRAAAREVSFTSIELERSKKLNQPIDVQKLDALNLMYQMNTDQMVYIGDPTIPNATGLLNDPTVPVSSVSGGTFASLVSNPDAILAEINALLTQVWTNSAYSVCPTELRLPPAQYAALASAKVSSAGNMSLLSYLRENTISMNTNGVALNIAPLKWLVGRGVGGTDRMIAYTNDVDRLRFSMVPIRRETAYYQGIRYSAPYLWAYGGMEFLYPETVQYADGI